MGTSVVQPGQVVQVSSGAGQQWNGFPGPLPSNGPPYASTGYQGATGVHTMAGAYQAQPRHMWDLNYAAPIVRDLNKDIRPFGYHAAIGGGVINKGYSEKDLDIYILPLSPTKVKLKALVTYLTLTWGKAWRLGSTEFDELSLEDSNKAYPPDLVWTFRATFWPQSGRRIDLFIARDPESDPCPSSGMPSVSYPRWWVRLRRQLDSLFSRSSSPAVPGSLASSTASPSS